MTLYIVSSVLVLVLVAVSSAAFMLGLLGEVGVVRLARCPQCAHFAVTSRGSGMTCPYCRHVHLAHPLSTMRHPFRALVHH